MTQTASRPPMTAEDLLNLPDDGKVYELERGVLICMSPASPRSNVISVKVIRRLGDFVESHQLGEVGGSEGGFELTSDPDTVRAPDIWFVRAERVPPGGMPDEFFKGAPDIAGEVLSPSDRPGALLKKVGEYLEAGARLVWVLFPKTRTAIVYRADGTVTLVDGDGVIDGEDVLPGFTLRLRDVFPPQQ
jgi:Uma2 family endonuclease